VAKGALKFDDPFLIAVSQVLTRSIACASVSTTVQLIERYYDALEGVLTIDGVDVRGSFENQPIVVLIFPALTLTPEFDLRWFRSHVGLVSQEARSQPTIIITR
jgi:hypothetical protein